jgi:hypothetical protein
MTLKEKFRPHAKYWDCYNDEPLKYDHENKCVKIADEFAIAFADWIRVCKLKGRPYNFENTKELLLIYKKEKGL